MVCIIDSKKIPKNKLQLWILFPMPEQIFISHSNKDDEIVAYFTGKFDDKGIKPVLMEYEKWSREGRPNWMWIKDGIQKSKALFLILTKNLVKEAYTQNWIAFEIGVASTRIPEIPVVVFKEEKVDFPVPFLSHFFDESFSRKGHLIRKDFSETLLEVESHVLIESFIDELVVNPSTGLDEDETIECSKCLLRFHYWGKKDIFNCPCCSSIIRFA
jgi:TIR domain